MRVLSFSLYTDKALKESSGCILNRKNLKLSINTVMELGQYFSLSSPKCFFLPSFAPRKMIISQRPVTKSYQHTQNNHKSTTITTIRSSGQISGDKTVESRSATYKPNIWDFSSLELLKSEYTGEIYEKQSKKLQEAVRLNFNDEEMTTLARLELIDTLERLGIGYLFKNEIKRALDKIVTTMNQLDLLGSNNKDEDLHAISIQFRLLRQHGYEISQEVFASFMKDIEMGIWKTDINEDAIKGILSLYEASHLAFKGETILDKAKAFATKHLNEVINTPNCLSSDLAKQVEHSLEIPLHWRMQRLEARWYIDSMSTTDNMTHSVLLQLAKLDYNMLQAIYQNDLREMSSWWKDLGFDSELSFARNRLLENFLMTINIGGIYEPQLNYCRKEVTKLFSFLTTVDDVYDVYGTLDELELFTDIVERWDINAMDQLPNYMKMCFLALYNSTNEIAYNILKETHWDIIKYLKKTLGDLCKSDLKEKRWHHNKYTPTFDEYLNNAWISVAIPALLVHVYILGKQEIINKEALDYLVSYPDIIRRTSMIFRLYNDLGTSAGEVERGESLTSIHCYMVENGVSEDVAREYIRNLINEMWKQLNKDVVDSSRFSQDFTGCMVNFVRVAQCIYQYGDGYSAPDGETKDQISLVLFDSISV